MRHIDVSVSVEYGKAGDTHATHPEIRLPSDVPCRRLAAKLAKLLALPELPANRVYALTHASQLGAHLRLSPAQTLDAAGIFHGAHLTLCAVNSAAAPVAPIALSAAPRAPLFHRPPRARYDAPAGVHDIAPPPGLPQRPQFSLVTLLVPGLFAISALIMAITTYKPGNSGTPMNFLFSAFTGVSALLSFVNYRLELRKYTDATRERSVRYDAYLEHKRAQLLAAATRQRSAALDAHPAPDVCFARIAQRRGIWMRERDDDDFMCVRAGIGTLALSDEIKTPSGDVLLNDDPLFGTAYALAHDARLVAGSPVLLDLRAGGAIGLAGPRAALLNTANALALGLIAHHTPDDVRVVVIAPEAERDAWRWLNWAPHVWMPDRALRCCASDAGTAHRVLEAVLRDARTRNGSCAFVLFLAESAFYASNPAAARMLREAQTLGVTLVFFAAAVDGLPRECRQYIEFDGGRGRLFQSDVRGAPQIIDVLDAAPADVCETAARHLAAIVLQRTAVAEAAPAQVSLLDLWQVRDAAQVPVREAWRSHAHLDEASLAVTIGRGAGGVPLRLDLRDGDRGDGAHGLVAGTTGSGKSELLQTLIAALAARFHPDWLSFLLIDYKGGGMANAFLRVDEAPGADGATGAPRAIPHIAGVITNLLDGASARRALIALESELRRRQRLFDAADVTYIDAYQRRYAEGKKQGITGLAPMPRLVIIVDEFAELKREQPDFMRQLISAARIGRSLGVHLILATQKPSGVVDDQIWSNSRFKLCLRVQTEGDSKEMLKRPDAAQLQRAGQALLLTGSDERYEAFQSAYGGAVHAPDEDPDAERRYIAVLRDDGRPDAAQCVRVGVSPVLRRVDASSQLSALMRHVCVVATGEGVAPVERIFLDPLPERLTLETLARFDTDGMGITNTGVPIGLLDDPRERRQAPVMLDLDVCGHAMIFGQSGMGKTTLLQTLIVGLASRTDALALNLYVLDFGGRGLSVFEALPQVGNVLFEDDDERIARLFRFLRLEIARRKQVLAGRKFAEAGAQLRQTEALPRIVLVIDNYPAFARLDHEESVITLVRDGAALGIHVVLTANKPLDVRSRVSGNIACGLAFTLNDRTDYGVVVGRTGGLEPAPAAGRGLIRVGAPYEFQAALPAVGDTEAERAEALVAFSQAARAGWGDRPAAPRIGTLPGELHLRDLPAAAESAASVAGLSVVDLVPYVVSFERNPHLAITGAPQSGKTTLLQALAIGLKRGRDGKYTRVYGVDFSGSEEGLARVRDVFADKTLVTCESELLVLLDALEQQIADIRAAYDAERDLNPDATLADAARGMPRTVILIDETDVLVRAIQRQTKERLDALLDRGLRGMPVHVVVAGPDRALDPMDGWLKRIKDGQAWIVLGGLQSVGFGLRLPAPERDKALQPGHGYAVTRATPRPVRVCFAQPFADDCRMRDWIEVLMAQGTRHEVK
jgi:DNA segregation ATPase FtsK/SpoIIIE, S-DNA-T family